MKLKRFIIALAAIAFVSACSKDDDPDLDLHKYVLSLEDVAVVGQEVGILMETVEEYSCSNFILEFDLEQGEDEVSITVGDVVEPSECLPALGPATGQDKISGIDSDIPISIQADGRTLEGKLTVTETDFILTL